ncbi:MAG: CoA pyrophosphatase [Deltaproteobacteria bacterium]|nr:MAG: CoA pyrophosphatase [Deltaproteobacteria bacterium]
MQDRPILEEIRKKLKAFPRHVEPPGAHDPAAVALTLLNSENGIEVLFTKRTDDVEHHKGEISFPGGRMDPGDASLTDAALRETWEEVGIEPHELEVLGYMDDRISISGYLVTPVVVYLERENYPLKPQPREVDEIIRVPLSHLVNPDNYRLDTSTYPGMAIHRFTWEQHEIWGLTGAIMNQFLELVFNFPSSEVG